MAVYEHCLSSIFLYIANFRYVQIIVITLEDTTLPDPPYTYKSDKISTANESVQTLIPYVTAQLAVDEVNQLKTFVIGDGKNYGHSLRRRREVESFTTRYDNVGRHWRTDRSEGSRKATSFYNRPLMAGSIYSAFQRTFVDEVWLFPVKNNLFIDEKYSSSFINHQLLFHSCSCVKKRYGK